LRDTAEYGLEEYELQIQEPLALGSQYRIGGQARVEICFYGCEMTLLGTGQRVRVNLNDSVVINYRVMNVHRAVNERGGW
jgi:hypothetical protein